MTATTARSARAATSARRRLLLVPDERRPGTATSLRRYRLARVQLDGRDAAQPGDRFAHLRRTYD